jgi:hypothetical protein
MGVFLSHVDMTPVFYGLILALWALVILRNIIKLRVLNVALDIGVFYVVFSMHQGTMTGGMAATICGLVVSLFGTFMLRRLFR